MFTEKYAIRVTPATQALCMFLNDGVDLGLQSPPSVLLVEINAPCEITTKLEHPHAVFGDGVTPKDPDLVLLVTE